MLNVKPYLIEVATKRDQVPTRDQYPYSIPAVRELHGLKFHPDVTFIIGENGCGKSTLLEAIAVAWGFNPEVEQSILSSRHAPLIQIYTNIFG